jgi:hypothetical protein
MAEIPTVEPTQITAGDTLTWQRSLSDYPASAGWVLSYALTNADGQILITATASGDDHLVSVAAATTAAYVVGTYAWQAYVTKTTERYMVGSGTLAVLPNLAVQGAGYDGRSWAQQQIDAIERWMTSHDQAVAEYQIAGRAMKYWEPAKLLALRDSFKAEVARSTAASAGTRLVVRF